MVVGGAYLFLQGLVLSLLKIVTLMMRNACGVKFLLGHAMTCMLQCN